MREIRAASRNVFSFIALLSILICFLCLALPGAASAADPATELTVKLNNTTVKVFTLSELGAMPQITQGYSSIDSMPATCLTAAQGVKVTDILTAAGIDVSTVQNFKFRSTDGYYASMTRQYLLDTKRYFYPNMIPANFNSCPTEAALVNGVKVDPILALLSYYQRSGTTPNFDSMDGLNSLRLCFGQDPLNPCEITSNKFAKWVNEINVDGSLLAVIKGDVNGDNTVNIQDVVLTVNCVLGAATSTPAQFSAADYNSDSSVNIQDVVMIVNKVLGN